MRLTSFKTSELVVVFDFSCLAYRAFYAKTENKGSYLLDRILWHLRWAEGLSISLLFALDGDFLNKKAIYPEYKANRKVIPNFNPKDEYLWILEAFFCYKVSSFGEEADDVIASLVEKYPQKKFLIITADSDMVYLAGKENVMLINERDSEPFTDNKYLKKHYLDVKHISLFKTVFGDPGDNVAPIYPRLQKKLYEDLIWLKGHDKDLFWIEMKERLQEKYKLTEEILIEIEIKFLKNWDVVIPRNNLPIEVEMIKGGSTGTLLKIHPSYLFLRPFFTGAVIKSPPLED